MGNTVFFSCILVPLVCKTPGPIVDDYFKQLTIGQMRYEEVETKQLTQQAISDEYNIPIEMTISWSDDWPRTPDVHRICKPTMTSLQL